MPKRKRLDPNEPILRTDDVGPTINQIGQSYIRMCELKTDLIALYHNLASKSGQKVCPNCKSLVYSGYKSYMGTDNPHESINEEGKHVYGCLERCYRKAFVELINPPE